MDVAAGETGKAQAAPLQHLSGGSSGSSANAITCADAGNGTGASPVKSFRSHCSSARGGVGGAGSGLTSPTRTPREPDIFSICSPEVVRSPGDEHLEGCWVPALPGVDSAGGGALQEEDEETHGEGVQDWQWELLNNLPHGPATRILQHVEQVEAENAWLREERGAHLAEIRRLDDALETLREDAAEEQRQLVLSRGELLATIERLRGELGTARVAEEELTSERTARLEAECLAVDLEARAAHLEAELQNTRAGAQRSCALLAAAERGRALAEEAARIPPSLSPPPVATTAADHFAAKVRELLAEDPAPCAEQLASAAWSCASLRVADEPLMRAIAAPLAIDGILADHALPAECLCDVAWAFSQQSFIDEPLLQALSAAVIARADARSLQARHCARLLRAMAAWRQNGAQCDDVLAVALVEALAAALGAGDGSAATRANATGASDSDGLRSIPEGDVAETLGALSALNVQRGPWTRAIVSYVRCRLADMPAAELPRLAQAAATLNFAAEELLEDISSALASRAGDFQVLE